jgi:hypothetical protein
MAPMETQVREHQIQLKRRLESIKRIHQATDTLEDRIDELNHVESNLVSQIHAIERAGHRVQHLLGKSLDAGTAQRRLTAKWTTPLPCKGSGVVRMNGKAELRPGACCPSAFRT